MDTGSKNWATEYLIDPLSAPQPSEEDGPGTSFRPQAQPPTPTSPPTKTASVRSSGSRLSKNNPYRASLGTPPAHDNSSIKRSTSLKSPTSRAYPSPPPSASYRQEAFSAHESPNNPPTSGTSTGHRRRTSSLSARHPGDTSHRPLDTLTREKARADKARHATRKHHIPPDTIDSLDTIAGAAYHHGGPYDATLFARNNSSSGPLGALVDSNAETLRATPRERVVDSVRDHRPLDGVASYAPGEVDRNGHRYVYTEGENMMIEGNPAGGAYKRWPGVQYHPDDIKGKGEPSYSIEKALKGHGGEEKEGVFRDQPDQEGTEMRATTYRKGHGRNVSAGEATGREGWSGEEQGSGVGRSGSLSKGLKKRWGSVKRHMHRDSE